MKKIKLINQNNKEVECDVLIEFEYYDNDYIVYTDNTLTKEGEIILYRGMIENDKVVDPKDIDVFFIFDKLITDYKNKVLRGEI